MTTFITGATGFIGGRLADRLVAEGERVRALVRSREAAAAVEARGLEPVLGDICDRRALATGVASAGTVFHTAGLVGDWLDERAAREVNVGGTARVLAAAQAAGVRRFVHLSSLSVLGTRHHYGSAEDAPYGSGDPYTDTKVASERIVREHEGLETVCLRPGFVYGPGDHQVIPGLIDALRSGRFVYVGRGRKEMNTVFVDDVVDACLLAAAQPRAAGQVYNLTDGRQTRLSDFVELIARSLRLPAPRRHIPAAVALPATRVAEAIARARRSPEPPLLNQSRLRFLYYNQHYSIEKARRELGYAPRVDYTQGLAITLGGEVPAWRG